MNDTVGPIKVSYSILAAWDRGDWDNAVRPFIGEETLDNEFMRRGKRWHRRFELETKRTGRMPAIFGGEELHDYSIEMESKRVVQLADWLFVSGVLDLIDKPEWMPNGGKRAVDYKVSKNNATYWANTKQGHIYKVLYPEADRFEFRVLNPYLKDDDPERVTTSIVHLTDKGMEAGLEWILTNASELRNYLVANDMAYNLMREKR